MRIFYSFLVVMSVAILFMLPITSGIYDFRTDQKEDSVRYETGAGETTANVTLIKALYDDDVSTVDVLSNDYSDAPIVENYTAAGRVLDISGLESSANRTLTITYDVDALNMTGAVSAFFDKLSWIWMICVICFAPAALAAMWMPRRE